MNKVDRLVTTKAVFEAILAEHEDDLELMSDTSGESFKIEVRTYITKKHHQPFMGVIVVKSGKERARHEYWLAMNVAIV